VRSAQLDRLGPLTGITVVDLTRVLAGPFCTMLLADMGAEVIKIEDPHGGDDVRSFPPLVDGWSSYFLGLNRNKKSVALDLKSPGGQEALGRLLARADVFVENFRPGGLARLGFGHEAVCTTNPRLIYCSISGYGQTGPRAHLSGYDPVIQAECGLMSITGFPDGPPTRSGIAVTDFLAGLYANQGILLALLHRAQTGTGQHIDIALFDAMLSTLSMPVGIFEATGQDPQRRGNEHASIAPYEVFEAHNGLIMICAGNDRLWRSLCDVISREDLGVDPRFLTNADRVRHRAELKRELQPALGDLTVEDLILRLESKSVPCGRVRSVAEALADPQVGARDMLLTLDVPGVGDFRVPGNPVKMSKASSGPTMCPPRLGEHTESVLGSLGYTAKEIDAITQRIVSA
jgi:crotonobetainyl-CoA:carnitine CoA-transferase CaiB-like acyl-CoA transferase